VVTHALKVWPAYFEALADGSKGFELRKDDRGFAVGDVLRLQEWAEVGGYSGREVSRGVSYILTAFPGLDDGYVVLGLEPGGDVLQAVLDAITGRLDTSRQISDHPNVKFALAKRLELLSRLSASPDVEARCVDLIAERERAMKVLQPNVPESGLEDACRQVKQAAISWRDNYETMEYVYDILKAKLEEAEARLTTSASPADVGPQAQGITAPASDDWMRGYETRIFEEPSTVVLQAVLEAISGTLDPHSQIADHPNVKFAQMERLKLLAGTVSQAQEKA
jgi:hypothetical protein